MTDKRRKIYQQIRKYNEELTDTLNKLDKILPENIEQLKTAELALLNKVSSLAVMKTQLYNAMNSE